MSDEKTRELWRRAGAGDLSAAIDYVIALMRGTAPLDPMGFKDSWVWGCSHMDVQVVEEHRGIFGVRPLTQACRQFLRPRTAEELRSMPILLAREVFADRRNPHEDLGDTLARWLVAHQGKVIVLNEDPPGFAAVEPPARVLELERAVKHLRGLFFDPKPKPADLIDAERALDALNIPASHELRGGR